jgi:hypothetical protein
MTSLLLVATMGLSIDVFVMNLLTPDLDREVRHSIGGFTTPQTHFPVVRLTQQLRTLFTTSWPLCLLLLCDISSRGR